MLRITLFILPLFFTIFLPIEDTNWKIEKVKNGITVYTHIPEGSNLKEIRMVSSAKATLSEAVAILVDVEGYPNWIYNCQSAKVINRVKNNEVIYYSVTKAPWPILDRDLVVRNTIYQNANTKAVYSQSEAQTDIVPDITGRIRIKNMFGLWRFTPIGNGEIEIEYYIKVDPAGILPPWVVNMFIANGPYQSMLNFKAQLNNEKYKNSKFDFIED